MKSWNTKEARLLFDWAERPVDTRAKIDEIADQLGRSVGSVQQFLRRTLPRGQRPWIEKPRWTPAEIVAVEGGATTLPRRTTAAIRKYVIRHSGQTLTVDPLDDAAEQPALTVTQVAADLGVSRATIYRLLSRGMLRRFKGGIAETSFADLLREHPEVIPYSRLPRDQKEWLILNGYHDPTLSVKRPTVIGILV